MSKRAEQFALTLYTQWSEDGMSRKDNTEVIEACIKGYEQAEEDFIERLAKFYPTLDYTFRSYLLQDFPELESKIKNCD